MPLIRNLKINDRNANFPSGEKSRKVTHGKHRNLPFKMLLELCQYHIPEISFLKESRNFSYSNYVRLALVADSRRVDYRSNLRPFSRIQADIVSHSYRSENSNISGDIVSRQTDFSKPSSSCRVRSLRINF